MACEDNKKGLIGDWLNGMAQTFLETKFLWLDGHSGWLGRLNTDKNVASLAPGTYMLQLEGATKSNKLFVKN